jgi:NADH:ubiquinone oxidoreductase subunit 5 (subunit L)/multisubunit Na+/H+ antiporter MnhA subunit
MTIAGLAALVEEDVKKVVALRTLSQIGLSMRTIGVGYH